MMMKMSLTDEARDVAVRSNAWKISTAGNSTVRCAITLAAGDGRRLAPFVRRLRGDALPKQFVNLYGTPSLLDRTLQRAERLASPARIFTVVAEDHLRYGDVRRQLSNRAAETVVIQPVNKDTGPGLLLPLTYLSQRFPDSVVAVFPSDHFVTDDETFIDHLKTAFEVVERHPTVVALLGIMPDEPEIEYGYIVPGNPLDDRWRSDVRQVCGFVEKPAPQVAQTMIQRGAVWNSSIMVFRTQTMWDLIRLTAPQLSLAFTQIGEALDTQYERKVIESVYRNLHPVNLSRGVIELLADWYPSRLAMLQAKHLSWSDWGSERRILNDLHKMGGIEQFQRMNTAAATIADGSRR